MKRRGRKIRKATLVFILIWNVCLSSFLPGQEALFKDPKASVDERARDLVSRMTIEEKIAQLNFDAPAVERLGVPSYNWWNEALHGVARNGRATVFPQAIGLAATWDEDLIFRVASAISDEGRAKFNASQRIGNFGRSEGASAKCEVRSAGVQAHEWRVGVMFGPSELRQGKDCWAGRGFGPENGIRGWEKEV